MEGLGYLEHAMTAIADIVGGTGNGEPARELGPDDDFGFLSHPDPGTF